MLRFFSKFQRSRNFLLLMFCLVLLVSLVIFFIPNTPLGNNRFNAASPEDDTVIAKVGDEEITIREFRNAMVSLGSRFSQGNTLPLATLRQLGIDKDAIDRLVDERLAVSEADRLNIRGTDTDVSEQVTQNFVDPDSGKFVGVEEYKRSLRLRGEDIGRYEANLRKAAALTRFRVYLTSAEQVSDREIERTFKHDNTKVEVSYAIIDLEKVRSKFNPNDAELLAYYEQHKDKFKANETVRKVDYIFIPTDEVAKTLKFTDEELKAQYDQNKQFEPRASIIKLNVLTPNDETTVKAKIDQLSQRVRGAPGIPAEDFAAVAKGNSQDPSAAKGGDLGFIKKEPNNTQDWKQRAHNIESGNIDGPFRHGSAYYIMKVTEKREVPFAAMRATVEAGHRNRQGFAKASQIADKAYEKATEYKDLKKAAEEIAKELNIGVDKVFRNTPFFKNGDSLPGWGNVPQFESTVSELKKGEIGDKVAIPDGHAIPQVVDERTNGAQLTFDEARNQVEQELRKEREPDVAKQRATEIVTTAKTPAEFASMLKAEGIETKTSTNLDNLQAPGAASGGLQLLQQARTTVINLKEGEISQIPIKWGAGYLIFAATKRTEPDMSKLTTDREALRTKILQERQMAVYDSYIKAARKRYEQDGSLKIYQDRIDNFLNSGQ